MNNRFFDTPEGLVGRAIVRPGCDLHYWHAETAKAAPAGPGSASPATMSPIIMLHGVGTDHRMFNLQVAALIDAGYLPIVMDLRGHGASRPTAPKVTVDDYVEDLWALMDREGLEDAVLVGQSLGGLIVQHAAIRQPSRVRALVTVGTSPISFPLSGADQAARHGTIALFQAWPWTRLRRVTAANTADTPETRAYVTGCLAGMTKREFLNVCQAANSAMTRQGFPPLPPELPVLWTHGDHDRSGNVSKDAPVLAESGLPLLDYRVIPSASHNANQDNAHAFNALLLKFLDRCAHLRG